MIGEMISGNLGLLLLTQGTPCLVAGLAASYGLRRRAARAHQVLITTMVIAVLLPGLYLLVHRLELGVLPPRQPPALRQTAEPNTPMPDEFAGIVTGQEGLGPVALNIAEAAGPLVPDGTTTTPMPWETILLLTWAAAVMLLLARLALRFLLALNVVRTSKPLENTSLCRAVEAARNGLAIRPPVRIHCSGRVQSPVIWCWTRRPVLLVQESGRHEAPANWAGILRHELAHWKRRDHLSGLVAELLVALVPWHPLLWWARARLLHLSEQACDDWAVADGLPAVDYAESLLDLSAEGQLTLLPAVVGKEKAMKQRIRRIVKDGCGNPRIGMRWALLASGLAVLLAVGVAFAQRPPAERPAREPAEREELRQQREREDLALAGRRNVLARLLDQLSRQARETEAALREQGDETGEEAIVLRSELEALRDHIAVVERQLHGLERPEVSGRRTDQPRERQMSTVSRERAAQDAEIEKVVAELQSQREKSARHAREMELKLGELRREGRDEETSAIEIELREVRENVGRLEREMANVERRRRQRVASPEFEAVERLSRELVRRRLELAAEMEQVEKSLQLCEERGEGQTDAANELREKMRGMREEMSRIDGQMRGQEEERSRRSRNIRTDRADGGEIVTRVFRLQHANPAQLAGILRGLISPRGGVASDERTGSIVLSDTPDNLARVEALVRELDVPGNDRGRGVSEPAQAVNREVEELRSQMRELRQQMQQMQKLLEQMAERSQTGKTAEPSDGVQEFKTY